MAAIPNLDLLKQVLLAPRATDCATCDMEAEAKRRRDAFEARHGAAALMQLGRLSDALRACSDALNEDPKLGKALLRAAHVHLSPRSQWRSRPDHRVRARGRPAAGRHR